jgi:hypothetical protein
MVKSFILYSLTFLCFSSASGVYAATGVPYFFSLAKPKDPFADIKVDKNQLLCTADKDTADTNLWTCIDNKGQNYTTSIRIKPIVKRKQNNGII